MRKALESQDSSLWLVSMRNQIVVESGVSGKKEVCEMRTKTPVYLTQALRASSMLSLLIEFFSQHGGHEWMPSLESRPCTSKQPIRIKAEESDAEGETGANVFVRRISSIIHGAIRGPRYN
jgi:hypothetical protein